MDRGCEGKSCFGLDIHYGLGRAYALADDWVAYGLVQGQINAAQFSGSDFRFGIGPVGGLLFKAKHWAWLTEANDSAFLFSRRSLILSLATELRWSPDLHWTLGAKASRTDVADEGSLTVARYF